MTNERPGAGLSIGLTGGLACGKSTVGRIWREAGVEVLDADDLAHESIQKGAEGYEAVIKAFGEGVVAEDGEIDRAKLGELVFGNPSALERLNAIVHPIVRKRWRAWTAERLEAGARIAVIIPLLFEVDETENWDAVVCVAAPDHAVRERLMGRGLDEAQIEARLAVQWPLEQKREKSDYVIENDGSIEDLEKKATTVLNEMMTKEKQGHDRS